MFDLKMYRLDACFLVGCADRGGQLVRRYLNNRRDAGFASAFVAERAGRYELFGVCKVSATGEKAPSKPDFGYDFVGAHC